MSLSHSGDNSQWSHTSLPSFSLSLVASHPLLLLLFTWFGACVSMCICVIGKMSVRGSGLQGDSLSPLPCACVCVSVCICACVCLTAQISAEALSCPRCVFPPWCFVPKPPAGLSSGRNRYNDRPSNGSAWRCYFLTVCRQATARLKGQESAMLSALWDSI